MTKFIIPSNVVSKKNSKQISVRGGKPIVRCSDRYTEWNQFAVMQLRIQAKGKHFTNCKMILKFFYGDRRKRDIDNGVASIFDTLKDAGVIEDDNYTLVPKCYVESDYDKDNPRAEIYIYEPDEMVQIRF